MHPCLIDSVNTTGNQSGYRIEQSTETPQLSWKSGFPIQKSLQVYDKLHCTSSKHEDLGGPRHTLMGP